jgi:hypothetical protein
MHSWISSYRWIDENDCLPFFPFVAYFSIFVILKDAIDFGLSQLLTFLMPLDPSSSKVGSMWRSWSFLFLLFLLVLHVEWFQSFHLAKCVMFLPVNETGRLVLCSMVTEESRWDLGSRPCTSCNEGSSALYRLTLKCSYGNRCTMSVQAVFFLDSTTVQLYAVLEYYVLLLVLEY